MNSLVDILTRETLKHGVISFACFMDLSLHCPVYGYYEKERDTIGRCGDYFTSVSVGGLFGELLAFQFAEWLRELPAADCRLRIAECGAHDGKLAKDILSWMREWRPELFDALQYVIVEPSARRKKWQNRTLREFGKKVFWAGQLQDLTAPPGSAARGRPSDGICGIIFSNELLDAMPVHRLGWDSANNAWFEWGVAMRDGVFVWTRIPDSESGIPHPDLPAELLEVLPDGFTAESCPSAEAWWREAAGVLRRGKLVTIDYGLTGEEYFMPERKDGTLRGYHRHHPTADLLANPGEQDLTAHVNFTAIQSAGEAAGLSTEQFTTQAKFLTQIAERVWREQGDSSEWSPSRSRQFQTLTHPEHLGHLFKVLVQSK